MGNEGQNKSATNEAERYRSFTLAVSSIQRYSSDDSKIAATFRHAEKNGYLFNCFGASNNNFPEGLHAAPSLESDYLLVDPRLLSGSKTQNEAPIYLYNHENQSLKKVSVDKAVDFFQRSMPDGKPGPEPELSFLEWLQNLPLIRSVFGRPERMAKYLRETEVYNAKCYAVLEEKGIKGLSYRKELLDEETAEAYISGTVPAPEKEQEAPAVEEAPEPAADPSPKAKEHCSSVKLIVSSALDVLDACKPDDNPHVKNGAAAVKQYLQADPELTAPGSRDLAQFFANGIRFKTDDGTVALPSDYRTAYTNFCFQLGFQLPKKDTSAEYDPKTIGSILTRSSDAMQLPSADRASVLSAGPRTKE